jgi:hypothetical protein
MPIENSVVLVDLHRHQQLWNGKTTLASNRTNKMWNQLPAHANIISRIQHPKSTIVQMGFDLPSTIFPDLALRT